MDERADREFVATHEPLVRKLALRVRDEYDISTALEDLMGYGYAGLLQARERFDSSRGVPFKSYAYYRIRGAILDGVREMARLPRRAHAQRKAAEVLDRAAEEAAEARASRPADRVDVAATLQSIDDIITRTSAAFVIAAIGQAERQPPAPDVAAIGTQESGRVRAALGRLPERERALLEGYYFGDRTLEELGRAMGISKSWASRLHSRAIRSLRDAMADD